MNKGVPSGLEYPFLLHEGFMIVKVHKESYSCCYLLYLIGISNLRGFGLKRKDVER